MKFARWPLALVVVLLGVSHLRAQVLIGPGFAGPGIGVGGVYRSGRLSIGFSAFAPAYGYYPAFYPYGYSSRTNVIQIYTPPPPPVFLGAPALPRFNYVEEPVIAPGQHVPLVQVPPREPPAEERPLPGVPAGGFRPVRPEDRARALEPVPLDPPKPPPEKIKPPDKPKVEEKAKPKPAERLPQPPLPEADPRAENARQISLGRVSFANQEYGRAISRFRQAITALPDDPQAQFLLAQTFFALGKYGEAVEAIHNGMRLRHDWPAARFQPLELYEPNVAVYPEHLRRLEETLAQHPDDVVLLFLYAYQLWFDGRKDEARPLFQRAAPRAADRTFIDRFLQTMPGPAII